MEKIKRKELKKHWGFLIDYIQKNHVDDPDVAQELFVRHKPVRGLCNQRGYFLIMDNQYFIQYVMDVIITEPELGLCGRAIQEVILYDDFIEYQGEFQRSLQSVSPQKQTGLNLN